MNELGYLGKMSGVKIKRIKLDANDIVVGEYTPGETPYDQLQDWYKVLKNTYPDNQVLLLPSVIKLKVMTRPYLKSLMEMIQRIYQLAP